MFFCFFSPDDGIDRTNNLVSQNSSMSMDGSVSLIFFLFVPSRYLFIEMFFYI